MGAVVCALALSACGSSGGSQATPAAGAVAILSFVVPPSVACGPAPTAKVPVSYAVDSARSQHVVVDGRIVQGTDAASHTITVIVPCDNQKHTIAFVVQGTRGRLLGRTKYVFAVRRAGSASTSTRLRAPVLYHRAMSRDGPDLRSALGR